MLGDLCNGCWGNNVVGCRSGRDFVEQPLTNATVTDHDAVLGKRVNFDRAFLVFEDNFLLLVAIWTTSVVESGVSGRMLVIKTHVSLASGRGIVINGLIDDCMVDADVGAVFIKSRKLAEDFGM